MDDVEHGMKGHAGVRQLLTEDHERLDRLFEDLLTALGADAREDAARLWAELDAGLSRHMQLEEELVFPALREHDAREAAELLGEHGQIRCQLSELGVGLDLHQTRVEAVREFVELLREHARREDALAYRWAERELPEPVRHTLRDRIVELLAGPRLDKARASESKPQ
jgi:hemerythrin-like domain-containing protein